MARVVAIRLKAPRRKSDAAVCVVELEGAPSLELDAETVAREGLRPGARIDDARREALALADEALRARRLAVRRSAGGPRTRAETEAMLAGAGFSPGAVARAVEQLEETGRIDDGAAAGRRIARRRRQGGYGRARLAEELRALGVDEATIDERLDAGGWREADDAPHCRELIRRKAARYRPLGDPKNRRRLTALLARRGFDEETIDACLREEFGDALPGEEA